MGFPLIVLTASSTEASEWNHSIGQQILSATIPNKYRKTFFSEVSLENESIKHPLWRFAGVPERWMRNRLYLNFRGYRRDSRGTSPMEQEIVPGFVSVRELGLNLIDATQLHSIHSQQSAGETLSVQG